MKYTISTIIFCIIAVLIIKCNFDKKESPQITEQKKTELRKESDSLFKELIVLKDKLKTIDAKDSVLIEMVENKRNTIDTLIKKSIQYKDNEIELIKIKHEVKVLKTENRTFFNRINKLHEENLTLQLKNDSIKNELSTEIENKRFLEKRLETVTKQASKLKLSGVKITSYTNSFFSKAKRTKTNVASKVKVVEISFVLPENKLLKPISLNIKACIYDVPKGDKISKDMTVSYTGEEINETFIFDDAVSYATGTHEIKIFVDGRESYKGEIKLD